MKISRPILVSALVIVLSASASLPANAQELNNTAVFGGTLNVVLANKNGAVILTESMLSDESGPVPIPRPETPGQKLFQLDDKTICAIAGFASVPRIFPEFSPSVSAVAVEAAFSSVSNLLAETNPGQGTQERLN